MLRIRLEIRKKAAATACRKFSWFKGRRRMQAKKDLKRFATECKIAIERLFASDIAELCSLDKPPPIVVALCTCVSFLASWSDCRADRRFMLFLASNAATNAASTFFATVAFASGCSSRRAASTS